MYHTIVSEQINLEKINSKQGVSWSHKNTHVDIFLVSLES